MLSGTGSAEGTARNIMFSDRVI